MAGIECLPFAGPAKVAETMAQSKFLVLPSRMEHWGVVVHEAALSGCGLLLSNAVGSVADLATRRNAILFPAGSPAALAAAMSEAVAMNAEQLERCSSTSLAVAARFSPEAWVRTFRGIVSKGLATSAGSQLFPPEVVPKVF
jgi:glycosyltransferase involved in cell wall biosynthesis